MSNSAINLTTTGAKCPNCGKRSVRYRRMVEQEQCFYINDDGSRGDMFSDKRTDHVTYEEHYCSTQLCGWVEVLESREVNAQ